MLHREIRAASSNATQLHGNNRKQIELVKVINIIQVVSVWFCFIQTYLKYTRFGTRFGTRVPACAKFLTKIGQVYQWYQK